MNDDDEVFQHRPDPWTIGQLREAMKGLPDDLSVQVLVPPGPGAPGAEHRVVTYAGLNAVAGARTPTPGDGHVDEVRRALLIECDYSPGSYQLRE